MFFRRFSHPSLPHTLEVLNGLDKVEWWGKPIFQGYRLSEASVIAPFEYIGLPLAIFWGIVVFQDYPDPLIWVGIGLIVGAGLYTVYREAVRGRKELFSDSVPRNR